ncbi:hypothetical protein [Polluticoccus soli]
MKQIKIFIYLAGIIAGGSSCNKSFLDRFPKTEISEGIFSKQQAI